MASSKIVFRLSSPLQNLAHKVNKSSLKSAFQSQFPSSTRPSFRFSRGAEQLRVDASIAQCNCFGAVKIRLVVGISVLGFSSSRYINAFMIVYLHLATSSHKADFC